VIRLPRGQALAFRLARHHLATRLATAEPAAVVGLQDTPPGTAALRSSTKDALAAEADRLAPFRGADTAELRLGAI
jgi:hypothetical protein